MFSSVDYLFHIHGPTTTTVCKKKLQKLLHLYFFYLQGTICLDIAYVPPGGDRTDGKNKDEIDNKEDDGDEDHDKDDESDESDEKHTGQVNKKSSRRRLARKWSDKTKDFQVI